MTSSTQAPRFPEGWTRHTDRVAGIDAVSWSRGAGRPLILLHGIGPGTVGAANFEPLLATLSAAHEVHLLDLIGFGASGRKQATPFFDVELWSAQIEAITMRLDAPAVLIGNSVGGALALRAAARLPGIAGAVAIGSPLCDPVVTPELRGFWSAPADAAQLAAAMQPMTGAARPPAEERVAARYAEFARDPSYRAYFASMTEDAAVALNTAALDPALIDAIRCPLLVVHGTADRACPLDIALSFIRRRPDADLTIFGDCGHNVTWERTTDLLAALDAFVHRIQKTEEPKT
ncbi:alpha/beta hydrolase [Caballeronia sp. LZ043]|uniref:alpha/beta fold hydrolase n=1 Tax=Caballeronia sp. LZ043 TaxID=3038569 RepID=UPI0028628E51|nr:alpha/beta hydrolase [Caballeronia sp. LZ043]MDR5822467.1 alpha/beta hydrolase [Caballeronia sp. LZ043]